MTGNLWERAMQASPTGWALLVLIGSTVLAVVVGVVFDRLGRRVVARTRTDLDDIVFEHLRGPVALTVLLAGAWYALHGFTMPGTAMFLGDGMLFSVGVMAWSLGIGRAVSRMLDWLARNRDRYPTMVTNRTLPVLDMTAKVVVWGGTAYFLFLAWQVDVTAWLASAGILGVALGFASQDTLSNLVSGVFILADAPYRLGDWVVLDSGERGMVVEIGMRTTRLRTRDDVIIILPNKVMANARIQNQSTGSPTGFRVRAKITLPYDVDLPRMHTELAALARGIEGVVHDPEPRVRLRALGHDGLDHELLFWVADPALRGQTLHRVLTAVVEHTRQVGVEIPFPQRTVHVRAASDVRDASEPPAA